MRYDFFSSSHLSIPSLPIPILLSSPILPPSFSSFLCSLFFPPLIPSFLPHFPPTLHSLSLSPMYPLPPFLPLSSFPPSLLPPSLLLPTLYHFSHPLPLFSPSSYPPLSLDSYLPFHCLFLPLIPPNDLQTAFLPICLLANRFNIFELKALKSTSK